MTPDNNLWIMPTHNPENEQIKHRYFAYLKEAQRRGEPSVMQLPRRSAASRLTPASRASGLCLDKQPVVVATAPGIPRFTQHSGSIFAHCASLKTSRSARSLNHNKPTL